VQEAPIAGAACNAEHPCPSGYACVGGTCRALGGKVVLGCADDGDCPVGVCLQEVGFCVQCTEDAHCAHGVCLAGRHQCGCEEGAQCTTGRCQVPDGLQVGYCAACYDDSQCPGAGCDRVSGECKKVQRGGAGS
jgi:Cys-rich repeat protein